MVVLLWQTALIEVIILCEFKGPQNKNAIALSFDDGPDWGEEALLSELNAAGMRATFFWIWEKVEMLKVEDEMRFERILRLIKDGGHEVGIHGYHCRGSQNPVNRFLIGSETENIDILKQHFHDLMGDEPEVYRSHGPRAGREFYNELLDANLKLIFGSLTHQISVQASMDKFIDYFSEASQGTIICGHDSRNCESDYRLAVEIADVVPELAQIVQERNITIITVSELLN